MVSANYINFFLWSITWRRWVDKFYCFLFSIWYLTNTKCKLIAAWFPSSAIYSVCRIWRWESVIHDFLAWLLRKLWTPNFLLAWKSSQVHNKVAVNWTTPKQQIAYLCSPRSMYFTYVLQYISSAILTINICSPVLFTDHSKFLGNAT